MAGRAKPTKDEIVALEKSYWDAMKRKDGRRTAELAADPSLVINPNGMMKIARDKMGAMTESGDWTLESYAFEDVEVSVPTDEVAIIAYTVHQKVTIGGKPQDLRAADSSTWVRGPKGWECHAHSEVMLKDVRAA